MDQEYGRLRIEQVKSVYPGHLIVYKCIDRDFNEILVEKFRLEGSPCDMDLLPYFNINK